jgi:alanine dehydrogenase
MRFGVPKESSRHEHRVGLSPFGVARLVELGHEVFVEHDAGAQSHFHDESFKEAGAKVVYGADEVCGRAQVICRVSSLRPNDVRMLQPGTTVCGFLHVAMASREVITQVRERELSLIGYELLKDGQGRRPLLRELGEIAAQMVVSTAAHLLEYESGGRGMVLGGAAGISPATVVILGAGWVGRTAAALFISCGAQVIVLDSDLEKLREVNWCTHGRTVTALASERHLQRFTSIADVLVGAVLVPGGRAPYLVTEEMVKRMKPGSVILDLSIDQGGCVETSRPTTLDTPTFKQHGVIHYCVPNMTSNTPLIATRAIAMAALPYLERMAEEGVEGALRSDPGLAAGAYFYRGKLVNEPAAGALELTAHSLSGLLGDHAGAKE